MQTLGKVEDSTAVHNTPTVRENASLSSMSRSYVSKIVKNYFPRYEGKEDPTIWLSKVEQFFQLYGIPVQYRVELVSPHLDGDAHLWYQLLKQERGTVTWKEFRD